MSMQITGRRPLGASKCAASVNPTTAAPETAIVHP